MVSLAPHSEHQVLQVATKLFTDLRGVVVKTGRVGSVGASKVLFAALPKIALPVDNAEWTPTVKTTDYRNVPNTLIHEIKAWEQETKQSLNDCYPHPPITLPVI